MVPSVDDVAAHVAQLNGLPSQISISDTASNVDTSLSTIAQLTGLQSITLTDGGTPALSMSVATLGADASTLAKITSPFTITISDTGSHIAADLALGNASLIKTNATSIGQIVAGDGQPVILTQSQVLAAGVDDGPGSAMSKFSGVLDVTSVDVSHLAQVTGLAHTPASISVNDTSAHLAADLAQGGASALLTAMPSVTSITSSDGAPVSLTASQVTAAGVDDGVNSAIALLHNASVAVTGASVADLSALAALYAAPTTISVSDNASAISADLASGSSALISTLPVLASIFVSDGQSVSLTESEVLALHVDDGTGSALSKLSGGSLLITQVAASDLAEMLALNVPAASLSIADTSAHIVSNLSSILDNISVVSGITVTSGGPLTLTADEALETYVDDRSGSLVDLISGHAFNVSGATVSQLGALLLLPDAPTSVAVSDSSAHIVADLMSGSPALALVGTLGILGTITVTHGTLTLTDAQADTILASPTLDGIFSHFAGTTTVAVTGVTVADLAAIAASTWPHVTIGVVDSAANLATDLGLGGSSVLTAQASSIGSVTLGAGGTVNAATLAGMASLPHFTTGGFPLELQDAAALPS